MRYMPAAWAFLFLTISVPAGAKERDKSWKKPANSYAQFVYDSIECAEYGYFRDVSTDEPAKAFVRGWQTADDNLNRGGATTPQAAESWADTVRRTQPARRIEEVQKLHVGDVERCLTDRGYSPFTLSKSQSKLLAKLPRGSDARRRYLYDLSVQ